MTIRRKQRLVHGLLTIHLRSGKHRYLAPGINRACVVEYNSADMSVVRLPGLNMELSRVAEVGNESHAFRDALKELRKEAV